MKKMLLIISVLLWISAHGKAQKSILGKTLKNVELTDANDVPKVLPFYGQKVLTVFYTDPDVKDVNNPLSDAIKAKNFDKSKYQGIGVANCKDTWIPNSGIKMKARQKERDFPGSVILVDASYVLPNSWGMGNCDEMGVIVIVGKDKTVKYFKHIKTQDESKAIIPEVIACIEKAMSE